MIKALIAFSVCVFLSIPSNTAAGYGTVPSAKKEKFTGKWFNLRNAVVAAPDNRRAQEIAYILAGELNRRNPGAEVAVGPGGNIKLVLGDGPEPQKEFQKRESYFLKVEKNGITITANKPEGLFNGAATLINLSEQDRVPTAEIEDYPAMEFRGLHLNLREPNYDRAMEPMAGKVPVGYYGKSIMYSMEWLKNFVRECGLLKYNQIVFECDDKVQWRATPDKRHHPSLSAGEVQQWCEYARKYNVSICPLVNAPGHAHWYTSHGKKGYGGKGRVLEEGYRVDVADAKVREDFKSIMEDECNWFTGEYVHIAADETESAHDFLDGIIDVARSHGKQVIAWDGPSASFLSNKGCLIMLWDYRDGFRPVPPGKLGAGGIWSNSADQGIMGYGDQSENVYGWGKGVVKGGGLGMLTTVWMNYPGPSYEGLWEQVHMAAQASWGPESRPDDYDLRFSKQFFGNSSPAIYKAYLRMYAMKEGGQRYCFYLRAADAAVEKLTRHQKKIYPAKEYLSMAKALQTAVEPLECTHNHNALDFLRWYGLFVEFHACTVLGACGDRTASAKAVKIIPAVKDGFRNIWGFGMNGEFAIESWEQVVDSRLDEIERRRK